MTHKSPPHQSEHTVGAQSGENTPTALTALTGQSEQSEQWGRTPRAMHPLDDDTFIRHVFSRAADRLEQLEEEAENDRARVLPGGPGEATS